MQISNKQLKRFRKLWEKKSGNKLSRSEAVEEFNKLIQFVKMEVESTINIYK